MLASLVNTCFGALDPPRGHRPVFLQFETRGPGAGAGIPDERDRNRVSVSKSICHSEFPESTRACACAQGRGHSESMQPALAAQIPRGIAIAAYARGIKRQWFDPGVEHACYFSSVVGWHGTFRHVLS